MSEQIAVEIDMPEVTETAYRVEVRCGDTSVDVYEHGQRGSGDWVAWLSGGGYTVGGTRSKELMTTLNRAQEYVIAKERARLARKALREALDGGR